MLTGPQTCHKQVQKQEWLTGGTNKADNVKDYISWAVEHNVGVIDVNIPKHISEADVSDTTL